MTFAVVLAGGIGSRMGNTETPKQYLVLGNKPIIIHTIERFFVYPEFEHVIVLAPKAWVAHTENMIKKSLGDTDKVSVVAGGSTRNETLMNAIRFIEENYGLDDDTIIVTHDAVRPFVTHRIIEENIAAAKQYGACDTVVPATDTIVESQDGEIISQIPNRATLFQGQTPQSFNAKKLKELYESLTDAEKDILTDACKIFAMKGEKVYLVQGEVSNMKITYPFDLKVAATMLGGDFEE
ncbi:MAG: 2-C-methyl-D-erythritol 4-phosphate cytidylyltransferase [Oscillospiraceae bacterium]|nr:2-C-methyl-D-erythritol 4-phosphate cytidylyltransferase [Candidatus Limimonas coprohippi]MCQ2487755.1 2-C-methyl-D-erythritol 4-phosphate cytidylyltransferase [Clostridia bacterium]